jgi:hypothetical protein
LEQISYSDSKRARTLPQATIRRQEKIFKKFKKEAAAQGKIKNLGRSQSTKTNHLLEART